MKEIKIVKFIIRLDNEEKRGSLIGLDKDKNEYTLRYWDGIDYKPLDIVVEMK